AGKTENRNCPCAPLPVTSRFPYMAALLRNAAARVGLWCFSAKRGRCAVPVQLFLLRFFTQLDPRHRGAVLHYRASAVGPDTLDPQVVLVLLDTGRCSGECPPGVASPCWWWQEAWLHCVTICLPPCSLSPRWR